MARVQFLKKRVMSRSINIVESNERGCVTLFLAIPLHTNLSYNRLKLRNTGFIPKKNIKQVLESCNEVRMVKIGRD